MPRSPARPPPNPPRARSARTWSANQPAGSYPRVAPPLRDPSATTACIHCNFLAPDRVSDADQLHLRHGNNSPIKPEFVNADAEGWLALPAKYHNHVTVPAAYLREQSPQILGIFPTNSVETKNTKKLTLFDQKTGQSSQDSRLPRRHYPRAILGESDLGLTSAYCAHVNLYV